MKVIYSEPELEVIYCMCDDVIRTSVNNGLVDGGIDGEGNGDQFGDIIRP